MDGQAPVARSRAFVKKSYAMTNHGEFNWHELQTRDPERIKKFYAAALGWEFHPERMPSGGTYWLALAHGKPIGGILEVEESAETNTDRWVTYIHVDRLDEVIERAKQGGASILREPWDVPGVGRVAMIREPGGAYVGWVTPVADGKE